MELVLKGKKVTSEDVLTFKTHPKREGSNAWSRYSQYETAETLEELFELNEKKFVRADLRFDWEHGHVAINGEKFSEDEHGS